MGRLFGYDLGLVNPGKGIADAMGFSVGFAALAIPFLLSGLALFLLPKTK